MNSDLTPAAWKLMLVGLAAGLVGGGLGIGGGIVLVPLLLAVGFDRHRSHATSLAAIVLIAAAGALSWGAEGQIDVTLGILIGLGGVFGSVLGASLMDRMSSRALSIVFGIVLLIAAIRMITGANPLPGAGDSPDVAEALIAIGIGLAAGLFAGVAGVGGGVVIVPASVFFLGLSQHQAQGTTLLAIVMTASAATIVNLRNQRVRLKDGLVIGSGGVVGSVVSSRLALGIDGRTLSLLFGFLVLFVAIRTLYRATKMQTQST